MSALLVDWYGIIDGQGLSFTVLLFLGLKTLLQVIRWPLLLDLKKKKVGFVELRPLDCLAKDEKFWHSPTILVSDGTWTAGFVTLDQPQPTYHVNINTLGSTLSQQ